MKFRQKIIFLFIVMMIYSHHVYAKYVYTFDEVILELSRDTNPPVCNVTYSTEEWTNQNVVVTITSNKEVEQVSGFVLSEDKKVLQKEVSKNESNILKVRDLSGNSTEVEYNVSNIDKEPPQILGCEDGGKYKSPLNLEYYDNDQIKEVKIDKYSTHLFVTAYQNQEEPSQITVSIDAHPLNTKKYRYYVNDELYSTVTEPNYIFTSFNQDMDDKIKIEALDEFGNILDTVIVEEIRSDGEEKNLVINQNELTESGNYQIKVSDLAGNETIYNIKIE